MACLKDLYAQVRNDNAQLAWVVAKPTEDLKGIVVASSGPTGLDAFRDALDECEGIAFGVLRVLAVDDRGTVKSVRPKFVRAALIPDALPVIRKAKAAHMKPEVDATFDATHASFDIAAGSELTEAVISQRLQATCGAHAPSHYDFSGCASADNISSPCAPSPTEPKTEKPAEKPAEKEPEDKPEDKPQEKPAETEEAPKAEKKAAPGLKCGDGTPIQAAWDKVKSDKDPINWIAVTYTGKDFAATAELLASGAEGLEQMVDSAFPADKVVYAALRVTAVDDRGTVQSVRAKYVLVQFIGPEVKPLARAQAGPTKAHFEELLHGTHIFFAVRDPKDELTPKTVEAKLQASTGAHKPNRYDFGVKPNV